MVKCTGRALVVKRLGVLSKVQMLNLVLGVGVFPLLPINVWSVVPPNSKDPPRTPKQLKWIKSDSEGSRPKWPKKGSTVTKRRGFRSLLTTFHPFFGPLGRRPPRVTFDSLLGLKGGWEGLTFPRISGGKIRKWERNTTPPPNKKRKMSS